MCESSATSMKLRDASVGRIARTADPFGHGVCFIQFVDRGYDEIAGQ